MSRVSLRSALALAALLVALPACDSSEPEPDGPLAEAAANLGAWTWIDVEGSVCRDGSPTGIGVRLQEDADDLMIYLEGGGACFNAQTCNPAANPNRFSEADFGDRIDRVGEAGILSSTNGDNPVADWNMVYVPYCTGDVHAGSFPNNSLLAGEGVGTQQFVGHDNVERALALLADGLDAPDRVLLSGSSAGGLGALFNFDATARTFAGADLTLLDDSGPLFFEDNVLSPQLAAQVVGLYNASVTVPNAGTVFGPDGLPGLYELYAGRYPDANFGLASYLGDDTFQFFYGFGQIDPATGQQDPITDDEYAAALRSVRQQVPEWATYFVPGDDHTFLLRSEYYGTSAGVSVAAWLDALIGGTPTDVDPATARVPLAAR